MRGIGTAEGIARRLPERLIHCLKVAVGEYHVAVKDYEVAALGTLRSVVTALPGTAVLLCKVAKVKPVFVLVAHVLARHGRTVFHDDYLKISKSLTGETAQQFINLVRPVIHWYYYTIVHKSQLTVHSSFHNHNRHLRLTDCGIINYEL